jgi:hypothetical protein
LSISSSLEAVAVQTDTKVHQQLSVVAAEQADTVRQSREKTLAVAHQRKRLCWSVLASPTPSQLAVAEERLVKAQTVPSLEQV